LWSGGITFGGVVAFVFADLITLPLLLIYRKYYGARLTLKLLATFWATMSVAGLVTEALFEGLDLAPAPMTSGSREMVSRDVWGLNYTTVLDFVALAGLAVLYWLHRNRQRFGGGTAYATDPVCGMQVEKAHAAAVSVRGGEPTWFCSDHCRERYESRSPAARSTRAAPVHHGGRH
jgi:YHS domain-containing protein